MKNLTSILLIAGILLLVNMLSRKYFLRFDLTEGKQYSLSDATKNILKNLEDQVTVTAYFSENLPADIAKTREDFKDMLLEYSALSRGSVDYEFIDPGSDPQTEQEVLQTGIRPVMINVREKDQMKQQKAFLGAIVKMGDGQEVIPFLQPGAPMEYPLSTSIKKLSVVDKPSVGIIDGYGSPTLNELGQVYQELSILYTVEPLNLSQTESISDKFRAIALVAPKDSIPPAHFAKLDDYLSRGGKLMIAMDAVQGDFSTAQGTALTTGLETWLRGKGVEVENSFVIDASCGTVSVQQRQGFFTINTPVQFPYLPIVQNFADHPITKGLEQVMLTFASPVRFLGDSLTNFTPIVFSSAKSGILTAPTYFDVANKNWADSDFPLSGLTIGAVLESAQVGQAASKIVVIGDGDFAVTGSQGRAQAKDNISLMVNAIDWLSDDTGLIDLRTKAIASRPIEELEDSTRTMYKYLNFSIPILLVILYGFFRFQRKRSQRIKRMQERYV